MKNKYLVYVVLLLTVIFTGCSKEQEATKRREVAKEIDTKLVEKLSGAWLGEGEREKKVYDISYDQKELQINGEILEVTMTDNQWVKSQTKINDLFFYDFEVAEEKMIVHPSLPVENEKISHSLAPIQLVPISFKELEVHFSNPTEVDNYQEALTKSLSQFEKQEPFLLKMTLFTHEGDPIVESIGFNGDELHYYHDNSQDKFGEKEIINADYKQFKYEKIKGEENTDKERFILFEPVSKESEKEVVFEW